jgi:hypothetical protein
MTGTTPRRGAAVLDLLRIHPCEGVSAAPSGQERMSTRENVLRQPVHSRIFFT